MEQKQIQIRKNGASLLIDLNNGGKILELNLSFDGTENTTTVIKSTNVSDFLGDGSYLMFPWVNRIRDQNIDNFMVESIFKDGNGIPLHGLYANQSRKIVSQDNDSITFQPNEFNKYFPQFSETFRFLSNQQFQIDIQLTNQSNQDQKFAVGYHPYIQIGNMSINELELKSNMENQIKCSEKLLPLGDNIQLIPLDYKFPNNQKIYDKFLDNGFYTQAQEKYIEVNDPVSKKKIKLYSNSSISQIEALFWQIYTPPDRKRIAIEPQSSSADAFKLQGSNLIKLGPGEKTNFSFIIEASQ